MELGAIVVHRFQLRVKICKENVVIRFISLSGLEYEISIFQ